MEISEREHDGKRILSLKGRIDTSTAPVVQGCFEEMLAAGGRLFVIDLQDVEYVSSGGLRVLLIMARAAKAADGGIALACLHPFVEDLLNMAGFNRLIPTAPDVNEAILLLEPGATP